MLLKSKNIVITGAGRGLGKAIATEFVLQGANVLLSSIDFSTLENTREELQSKSIIKNQIIMSRCVNISDYGSVKKLCNFAVTAFFRPVDILVNVAGIQGAKGLIDETTMDDWLDAIDNNLIGTVMMCKAFIPHFKTRGRGKIINVAGGGATAPFPYMSSYAVSKVGIVRFSETIAEELKPYNIDVNCISPGALNTRMLDEMLEAGPEKIGEDYYSTCIKRKKQGGTPLNKAAELCTFLASDKSNGITGKIISAVWDKWEEFPNHLEEIKNSDLYTLRRITPKDRGMMWGDIE